MQARIISTLCGLAVVLGGPQGVPAQARQVLRVAPSGAPYAQITAAIAAANPGDTILVATGTYQPFTLSKGLTILADVAATPVVLGHSKIVNVPSSEAVVVSGVTFESRPWTQTTLDTFALEMGGPGGAICLKQCTVRTGPVQWRGAAAPSPTAALHVAPAFALLDGVTCLGRSGTHALQAPVSTPGGVLVINGGLYRGGDSDCGITCTPNINPAGCGIIRGVIDLTYFSNVTARGGDVTNLTQTTKAGCGLLLQGNGPLFVRGGSYTGGTSGFRTNESGGDGVLIASNWAPVIHHDGFPFFGGQASGSGLPGQPVSGTTGTFLPRLLSELALASAFLDRGTQAPLNLTARPLEPHVLIASFDAASWQVPGIPEPICSFATPRSFVCGLLTTNASGSATTQIGVPNDPGLVGLPVYFESFAPTPAQLVVGPLTGGPIR